MSFAIIETGGKQYKVSASKILEIEKLNAKKGETIKFKNVLLLNDNKNTEIGNPSIQGATVEAKLLDNVKDRTILVFHKRRRKHSRKKNGHRQRHSKIQITKILSKDGKVIDEAKLVEKKKTVKVEKKDLKKEDIYALKKGLVNLERHIENIKKFGLEPIVAINHFVLDTKKEINTVLDFCKKNKVEVSECKHWAKGGNGIKDLAKKVVKICNKNKNKFHFLYKENLKLLEKVELIAKQIYKANKIIVNNDIREQLKEFEKNGHGNLPVCIAKTQYSFSVDPKLKGAPSDHEIPIREVKLF